MNLHRTGHDSRGYARCVEPTWMHRLSLAVWYLRTSGRHRLYHSARMIMVGEF